MSDEHVGCISANRRKQLNEQQRAEFHALSTSDKSIAYVANADDAIRTEEQLPCCS